MTEKMNDWIKATDRLPEDKAEILTCYWDQPSERWDIGILTYYKKGTEMDRKIDRNPNHSAKQRLINTLFNQDYAIIATEDGFYISELGEDGDTQYRKHNDCITHWMHLPEGPESDNDK